MQARIKIGDGQGVEWEGTVIKLENGQLKKHACKIGDSRWEGIVIRGGAGRGARRLVGQAGRQEGEIRHEKGRRT